MRSCLQGLEFLYFAAMILDCPSCATCFNISDNVLASGPRRVRCARCQHIWVVNRPDSAPGPIALHDPVAVGHDFAADLAEMDAESSVMPAAGAAEAGDGVWLRKLVSALRLLSLTPRQAKLLSLLVFLAIVLLGVFGRHTLAARSPLLGRVFALVGVRYESADIHLDLQLTRAEKCLVYGRDMLCIEGTITHKGHETLSIPSIRVTALNVDGKPFVDTAGQAILNWTVKPPQGTILPAETLPFNLTVPYPDQAIADFDYGFADASHDDSPAP